MYTKPFGFKFEYTKSFVTMKAQKAVGHVQVGGHATKPELERLYLIVLPQLGGSNAMGACPPVRSVLELGENAQGM